MNTLSELKPVDIEKFRNQLLMRLQPGMINKIFYVLSVPLKYHCSIHNIPYQLLSVKKLSTAKQSKENARGALSLLEIQAILSLVPVEGDDKILVRMCKISLLTGVRISELRAIQAGDINRETGFLSIARQTKRHRDDTKGCKAGSSGRVPLFSPLTELLEEQVKHYGVELSGDDYLFIRWDGRKYKEDAIRSAFYRMLARIGIDEVKRHNRHLSFHSSRHSYVTMLQQAGFSMLQAMSAARHKKIEQTFVYSHPEALDFSKEKERLSGMLKRHNTVVS
jgi:integrase